jgi:hypothetical protein
MVKRLAFATILMTAMASIAFGVAGVVPKGDLAEWNAYWNAAMENYTFTSDIGIDYDAPFMVDTFTIPQARLCDTMVTSIGGWFNLFVTDKETLTVSLNGYKTWNGTNLPFYPPDSSLTMFPGYLGKNVILYRPAADTGVACGVLRIWWKYPPRRARTVGTND